MVDSYLHLRQFLGQVMQAPSALELTQVLQIFLESGFVGSMGTGTDPLRHFKQLFCASN